MKKKIELLSPVGGYEQFIAAVESGADAVYLGGSAFNARNSAANFTDDELKEAIKYAHIRGVKVHLTLNILIHDSEIEEAIEFAKRAYSYGVDAFIVQDLGLVSLIRETLPDAVLHFSTQGTVYSLDGVKAVEKLGFERVVLSRELTLDEIENICKNSDMEIEVFVHGALCISYSGQCRFSSLVGGRSGNRGKCAQPCRLKYTLCKEKDEIKREYILSPKDLCGINDLVRLIKCGVTSLKIEGRLKSPEYVACVTSIYRKYIDLAYELIEVGRENEYKVDEEDIKKLAQVFNRGGFSRGYYYGESDSKLMSYERPKHWGIYLGKVLEYDAKRKLVKLVLDEDLNMGDGIEVVNDFLPGNIVTYIEVNKKQVKNALKGEVVTVGDISGKINKDDKVYKISDKELNLKLKEFTDGKCHRKVNVDMKLYAHVGENVKLDVIDENGTEIQYLSDYAAEPALNRPLDFQNAYKSLAKLGDTPFLLNELKADIDGKALVPMSIMNEIRRTAVTRLEEKRGSLERKVNDSKIKPILPDDKKRETKISVYLYDTSNLEGLELADRIYVPINSFTEELCSKFSGKEVVPYLYAVSKNCEYNKEYGSILLGNVEHINIFKNAKNKYCDFSFNVFNSYTCKMLKELYGIKGVNLSFELNLEEIKQIKTDLGKEVTVYGRLPLMISEHCAIGSEMTGRTRCNLCKINRFYLKDRVGEEFPIITDKAVCRMQILNNKILYVPDAIRELNGNVDYFRVYFLDENTNERRRVLESVKNGKNIEKIKYTGQFYKGV